MFFLVAGLWMAFAEGRDLSIPIGIDYCRKDYQCQYHGCNDFELEACGGICVATCVSVQPFVHPIFLLASACELFERTNLSKLLNKCMRESRS